MVLIRFDSLFFFSFFRFLSVGRPKIQIFRATRFFSPTETTDFLSLPTDSTLFTMNNNNNDNKISTTDNNTNTTDNNTASATSVHFDLTEEETDYDDEEEEEEEVQEVDYDDLLLQYALNESFETEQPVNPPHLLKISPIVVPDHVSSVTVFCCACMEHYPQHEMHLFKNCPHGLCKHRCAAMYTSPFCPECKASLIEEEEEEQDTEEQDTEEQDTEEQTELKRMVDYTISQILKEIAEQEQQQEEEEEESRRRKRTKVH